MRMPVARHLRKRTAKGGFSELKKVLKLNDLGVSSILGYVSLNI